MGMVGAVCCIAGVKSGLSKGSNRSPCRWLSD